MEVMKMKENICKINKNITERLAEAEVFEVFDVK